MIHLQFFTDAALSFASVHWPPSNEEGRGGTVGVWYQKSFAFVPFGLG